MELVEHHVLQRVGPVGVPQRPVVTAQQQEVEHLVVREQDVGRVAAQLVAVVHQMVGPRFGMSTGAADVKPGGDAGERRVAVQQAGQAPGLVRGERVHRVEHERLHTCAPQGAPALAPAVVEDREQERLGLARTGAGGDERR